MVSLVRNRHQTAAPTTAPMTPAPATAVWAGGGEGTRKRSRNRTGRTKRLVSQPFSSAHRASARSGFTTTGWPTASSIGMSVAESE